MSHLYLVSGTSISGTRLITSQVHQHAELFWLLSTVASMGYLSRMTQWKVSACHGIWQCSPTENNIQHVRLMPARVSFSCPKTRISTVQMLGRNYDWAFSRIQFFKLPIS
jgi:tryptophanyl-tRNA synthetase